MAFLKPPIPDPDLDRFDDGCGVFTRDAQLVGHVFTVRGSFWAPSSFSRRKQWWIWYLVVWSDGSRERSTEDYPPYLAVREMRSGFPGPAGTSRDGRYDFAWLSPGDAASKRSELGITNADF